MSETDDTDALLTCDPGGGLNSMLATVDEVSSSQSASALLNSTDKPETSGGSQSTQETPNETKSQKANKKDKSLDVSDFFNSDGELVLSGLSQFSELSESDTTVGDRDNSSVDNADESSGESTSTVDTNTVVPSSSSLAVGEAKKLNNISVAPPKGNYDDDKLGGSRCKSSNGSSTKTENIQSIIAKVDNSTSVPEEIQADLRRQLLHANRTNPAVKNWLQSGQSQVAYGVLNLNLNDLKSFAEGLSRTNLFPSEKVSTFVPTTSKSGEQIFTRAPNFRTPGGYKPSRNPNKCRDLTEEQIREEVRKMYEFPDADDESEDGPDCRTQTKKSYEAKAEKSDKDKNNVASDKESTNSSNCTDELKKQFDFLHGIPVPNEFGKGKAGKPIKRKLLPSGGGICGGTIGSIPDLGFGIRDFSSESVEPIVERTTAYVTGKSVEQTVEAAGDGACATAGSRAEKRLPFTFGYGEEESMLSPIKSSFQDSECRIHSNLLQSERIQHSPDKSVSSNLAKGSQLTSDQRQAKLVETSSDSSDAMISKRTAELLTESTSENPSLQRNSPKIPSTPKRRLIRKAATKHRAMLSSVKTPEVIQESKGEDGVKMGSIASDLEKILSEIELPAEELESLINNLDEDCIDEKTARFFDDLEVDGNFVDAISQLKLTDWNINDEHVSEKYHAEKFKREQCERELRSLQENFLAEKQQTAVLEGTLKRRNVMLMQITMAFNRICKEWKKFDSTNKAAVDKLQNDQKVLAAACKQSRERISQYEKELHKTLELADSFKSKLVDVQKERDDSVLILKEANNELEGKIAHLKEEMQILKSERDATLRALRESQIKLDEGKQSLENMEANLKRLEVKDFEQSQKYEDLLQAKSEKDLSYLEVDARRKELEGMVMNLTTELNMEKQLKDQLRKDFQEEADRKSRAEAEKLHEYYNKKVQDILKSATEEAARAEIVLKEQMKRAALESERKLAECKERFQREMDILRGKYEAEIEKLKRENLHKQLLISSTVKQLQMGDSPNLDANMIGVSTRSPYQKEPIEMRRSHGSTDSSTNPSKASGILQLTKFTLDHLPSVVPQPTGYSRSHNEQHEDLPFDLGNAFTRFKTSTPIEAHASHAQEKVAEITSDSRHKRYLGHNVSSNGDGPATYLDKVRSEKQVNSSTDTSESKNLLSHLLEAPVRPEKEQQQLGCVSSIGKYTETPLDPALQKCIQELLKSYADKRPDVRSGSNDAVCTQVVTNTNPKENVCCNKNVDSSNNNDSERTQCTSSSDSQTVGRMDSRKSSKGKVEVLSPKCSAGLKPPWK